MIVRCIDRIYFMTKYGLYIQYFDTLRKRNVLKDNCKRETFQSPDATVIVRFYDIYIFFFSMEMLLICREQIT